jgi:cytochrome c-type biogenesis protein CcmF
MDTAYIGEHLAFGKAGNAFIILSFTASLLAVFGYLFPLLRKQDDQLAWIKVARTGFYLHLISVVSIVVLIFYLIHSHYFEYYYVWQHSSSTLPAKYMWACFWEGQEGSFLLWTFWNAILSLIIVRRGKTWEAPVMLFMMMIQVFLASMVLGLEIGSVKIGSNPFILLRNHPDFANLPFITMPDYLSKINDGRGLNPLLQNYWMVIHPPTLFLGFASTAIPFAFAMGGLVSGRVKEWVKPALPWTFFSIMILGTGILMGGAWAYEALSFGGFWAWDPVENASLVPWLTLAGAGHVMLIYKKNGTSLFTSIILVTITFLLILYSTFLTRSGILGDTSVHAFTDLGMSGQLLLYMLFFVVLAIVLMIVHRKSVQTPTEEESIKSREFWMFMGMLVLVISAVQITVTTSLPVINKIFDTKMAPPADAVDFYNSWQVPLAIVLSLLIAAGQFFRWKESDMKSVLMKMIPGIAVAIVLTAITEYVFEFARYQHVVMLFATFWAFSGNADYMIRILKGKIQHSGPSIAHMGVAFILLGALISNAEKHVISRNMLNVDLGKDFPNNENILLYQYDTLAMGEYYVTYKGKEEKGVNIYYEIEYLKANHSTGGFTKEFSLKPTVQINERMGNVSEPDTRHFIDHDIYTHITYAEMEKDKNDEKDEYKAAIKHTIKAGDTLTTSNALVTFSGLDKSIDKKALFLEEQDLAVAARLSLVDINRKAYSVDPVFIIRGNTVFSRPAEVPELGLKFSFDKIIPETNEVEISVYEKKANNREFVIMKAIIFPQINILWIGCILMILGTWIAIRKRIRENSSARA